MFYNEHITIPAGTAESEATQTTFKGTIGVISRVSIFFPPGCVGLVKVRIYQGGVQLYPTANGQYFSGDGSGVNFLDNFEILDDSIPLRIETWNEDDNNDHEVIVGVSILPKEFVIPLLAFREIADSLQLLLARIGVAPGGA